MQVDVKVIKTLSITFTEEEYQLFRDGIGNTSEISREEAGMSSKQAIFFTKLFENLHATPLF